MQIIEALEAVRLAGEEIPSSIQHAISDYQPKETEGSKSGFPRKSMQTWKLEFASTYKSGKFANHRTSRLLHEAKRDLIPYGEWTKMWEGDDRLFAVRKADKLAFVGEKLTSLLPLDRAEVSLP